MMRDSLKVKDLTPFDVGRLTTFVDFLSDFRDWYADIVVSQILISDQLADETDEAQIAVLYDLYATLDQKLVDGMKSSAEEGIKLIKRMPHRLGHRYTVAIIKDVLPPQLIEVLRR